jgi:hypothetical protein
MIFRWAPTPRGAKFALVSDQGAPIPPTVPGGPAPGILEIEVEMGGDRPPSPVTLLRLVQFMGLDADGHDLLCPALVLRIAPFARICSAERGRCDFNADGREDIRDLVLMIRCLRDGTLCGADTARFDCDGDGGFTLDDVLCCADRLMPNECAGCPPGESRDARDLKIAFGVPAGRERSIDLPIRIERAGAVGAARLAVRFPADRYEVRDVGVAGAAASWLKLWQVDGGRVGVGLIDPVPPGPRTAQDGPGVADFVVTLRLALKPGAAPGGEVALEGAEFSAYDGVALATEVPQLRQPLGGMPRIALSASLPNPFATTTRFALTLDRPGPVDVGIFDLGGRRLVTLHRGELPAGTREFTWDGRIADGTRARDGVYFYRAAAGSETLARKLVLLGGP